MCPIFASAAEKHRMHTQVELCSGHHPTTAARSRAEVLAKKLLDVVPSISCSTRLTDAKLQVSKNDAPSSVFLFHFFFDVPPRSRTIGASYSFTLAHSPLTFSNLSSPIFFPSLRYPLPALHLVCVRRLDPPFRGLEEKEARAQSEFAGVLLSGLSGECRGASFQVTTC